MKNCGRVICVTLVCMISMAVKAAPADSLKKYSYLLYGDHAENGLLEFGTCFFLKDKKDTYLVTAAHLLEGWYFKGIGTEKISGYPTTLHLRVTRKDNGRVEFIPIDISRFINRKNIDTTPDLVFCKIEIPGIYELNSIEQMMRNFTVPKSDPDSIFIYGYPPAAEINEKDKLAYITNHPGKKVVAPLYFRNYTDAFIHDETDYIDTLNYVVRQKPGDLQGGHSGSPAFMITHTATGDKISFGGMLIMGNSKNLSGVLVRPEIIKKYFRRISAANAAS